MQVRFAIGLGLLLVTAPTASAQTNDLALRAAYCVGVLEKTGCSEQSTTAEPWNHL